MIANELDESILLKECEPGQAECFVIENIRNKIKNVYIQIVSDKSSTLIKRTQFFSLDWALLRTFIDRTKSSHFYWGNFRLSSLKKFSSWFFEIFLIEKNSQNDGNFKFFQVYIVLIIASKDSWYGSEYEALTHFLISNIFKLNRVALLLLFLVRCQK
jgi:hypothetical protein